MKRYLEQAKNEYEGTPDATAFITTAGGEQVAMVRMRLNDGHCYVLAWIGAEYAEEPDEYEVDDFEDDWRPKWRKVTGMVPTKSRK